MPEVRIGRLLSSEERTARSADEGAAPFEGESLRSAFAISDRHVLTAWHCVRDHLDAGNPQWFRLRIDEPDARRYVYVPVRVTNYDTDFDAAVLAIDWPHLADAGLTPRVAMAILSAAAISLHPEVQVNDLVQVMGFPQSGVGADSDTNQATVVDVALPLGEVTGLKLTGAAFGAVSPVDPRGISGGPVLRTTRQTAGLSPAAIGIVRAVPRGMVHGAAAGASLIASRVTDLARLLPEVAVAMPVQPVSDPPPATSERNVLAVSRTCLEFLRESVVMFEDAELGPLTGWPHFFDEARKGQRPTAVGTAYGLKLSTILGADDGRLDRPALAQTLWKLRRADGGWATRTGSGIGRPEISALVLGALAVTGFDRAKLADAASRLEEELSPEADPVGMSRTSVVAAIMRGLLRVKPQSRGIIQLRDRLLDGATQDAGRGNLLCWASRLATDPGQTLTPSVPHTAIALVALARTDHAFGSTAASRSARDQALRWLVARRSLDNRTEQIRRAATGDRQDPMTINYFTPAWVARAVMAATPTDTPGAEAMLDEAIRQVWGAYTAGSWEWEEQDRPLWMSYQGACVIRDYALLSQARS